MRTEPPSPRRPVPAGSASRHVITTWEKSAGTNPAPRLATVQRPRQHAVLRAHLPWLPARPPPSARKTPWTGQPRRLGWPRVIDTRPCLAGPENLVGPLGSFIGALPDLHVAEPRRVIAARVCANVVAGFWGVANPQREPGRGRRSWPPPVRRLRRPLADVPGLASVRCPSLDVFCRDSPGFAQAAFDRAVDEAAPQAGVVAGG